MEHEKNTPKTTEYRGNCIVDCSSSVWNCSQNVKLMFESALKMFRFSRCNRRLMGDKCHTHN